VPAVAVDLPKDCSFRTFAGPFVEGWFLRERMLTKLDEDGYWGLVMKG
jgi:hypothetical protein